jgi:trehalose 6-phosphate phosphatase
MNAPFHRPNEPAVSAELIERLTAARLGLVLDYDGTLTPIVERPADARLSPAMQEALRALIATEGTDVAVVSGRGMDDLRERVPVPGVWLVGGHGAELRRPDGTTELLVDTPGAREAIRSFVTQVRAGVGPDVLVEDKGLCAAVHVRGLPQPEADRVTSLADGIADELARSAPVHRAAGKAVVELVGEGIDKGAAAQELLRRWRPERCAAIGDDLTDEAMFRALRDRAVTIKVGPEPTEARHRLDTVDEVEIFLVALSRARACVRPPRSLPPA